MVSHLDSYLIVYLLQHPIFILSRPVQFFFFSLLTCCCQKGEDIDMDNVNMDDKIISFGFVEYELGALANFENHPVGREEVQFNRALSLVR